MPEIQWLSGVSRLLQSTGVRNDAGRFGSFRLVMDWDDYKYFSALAATRSVRAAAEQLDVNPSTVSRRLEHFEERLGVQLFTRSRRGLTITPEGAEVIARVNEIASDLGSIEGQLIGQDQRLSGMVRVVIPEVIALSLLVKELPRFQELYPDIEISMVPGHQRPDLNVREADVLMEATDHPAENLVGRALSPVAIAAYGAKALVERDQRLGMLPSGEGTTWVEYFTDSEMSRACRRLRMVHAANARIQVRSLSLLLHLEAVRQGIGYAFLPCILAESDPNLLRVGNIPPVLGPSMWMLTHPDLRGTRRIKVFMDFVRDIFDRRAHELLGSELNQRQA